MAARNIVKRDAFVPLCKIHTRQTIQAYGMTQCALPRRVPGGLACLRIRVGVGAEELVSTPGATRQAILASQLSCSRQDFVLKL